MTEDPQMARNDSLEAFLESPVVKEGMAFLGIPPGNNVGYHLVLMAFNSGYVAGGKYVMSQFAPEGEAP